VALQTVFTDSASSVREYSRCGLPKLNLEVQEVEVELVWRLLIFIYYITSYAIIAKIFCTHQIRSFCTSGSLGTITWATDSTSPVSTLTILPKITTVLAISMTVPVTM